MLIFWTTDPPHELKSSLGNKLHGLDARVVNLDFPITELDGSHVVVALGAKAVALLAEQSLIPKNRTIASLREKVLTLPNGAPLFVTYSCLMRELDYEKYIYFHIDVNSAIRARKTGSLSPLLGDYKVVPDFSSALKCIEDMEGTVDAALDLETVGLDPYDPTKYIVSVQFSYKEGHTDLLYFPTKEKEEEALKTGSKIWNQLWLILNTPKISLRGANLKYDLNWLNVRAGLECTNFKFDTMLVGSLLDENRGNSLNVHTKWYIPELGGYDDPLEKKYNKARMDLIPLDDFIPYAGGDTDACLRVSKKMKQELRKDKALTKFYVHVLHPAARAYEWVERTGVLIDVDYYLALEDELEEEIDRLQREAIALMGRHLALKHKDNLNLTKAALLIDFMFTPMGLNLKPKMTTEKTGKPSTSLDHLLMFKDHPKAAEFVRLLEEYSSATKTLGTYVIRRDAEGNPCGGFLSHLRPDRRFHATYFLYNSGDKAGGTNTGRLSARDPAIQTLPKHTKWAKKLRRAFIAPPGMLVMSNDYSQGELKIAACLANEPTMIEAYQKGIDLHAVTASSIAGWELDEFMDLAKTDPDKYAEIRQLGKAGNFGLIYGMGVEGFMAYAATSYGVKLSHDEAEKARNTFFGTYSGLVEWHKNSHAAAITNKYVRSPLGRVRHLPLAKSSRQDVRSKALRQSVNAPVQSTLSDLALWATAEMHHRGWTKEAPVVAMVHDQLISYVPEDYAPYAARTKEVMENLPFHKLGWEPQLKFTVDTEVGPNLAELKKLKA